VFVCTPIVRFEVARSDSNGSSGSGSTDRFGDTGVGSSLELTAKA